MASHACEGCESGYYPDSPKVCEVCPKDTTRLGELLGGLGVVGPIVGVYMAFVGVAAVWSKHRTGVYGPGWQAMKSFTAWFMVTVAVLVQAGRNLAPNVPLIIAIPLRELQVLLADVQPVCDMSIVFPLSILSTACT